MRNLVIFFFSGLLLVAAIFYYAQIQSKKITYTINDPRTISSNQKIILSNTKNTKKTNPLPLKINIDKKEVLLYWPQKIIIETAPEVEVRVKVIYPNGSMNNSGTSSGMSDKTGKYTTQWTIKGDKKNLGTAKVQVSVGSLEQYAEAESFFEIISSQKSSTTTNNSTNSQNQQKIPANQALDFQTMPSVP